MAKGSSNKEEPAKSSVNNPSPPKKSKKWIWILLIGFAILIIIIIVIIIAVVVFGGNDSDTNTPVPPPTPPTPATCSSSLINTLPYTLTNADNKTPFLVGNGPNYLTDPGKTTGSTSNPEILTANALGWALINNSSVTINMLFYYVNKAGNISIITVILGATSTITWLTGGNFDNIQNPAFIGMTVQVSTQDNTSSTNTYVIPTSEDLDINPSNDIVVITYNQDNTITGSICRLSS